MTRIFSAAVAALLASSLSGCGGRAAPELYAKFQAAQQAFDAATSPEEFQIVAAQYEEILKAGFRSSAVLYNQGNAFARAGMKGRAVASYRQAQRYRPLDPYLSANLRSVRGASAATARPLAEYILFWQNWIGYPAKFQLSGGAALLTMLIAMAGIGWRKRGLIRLAGAVFVITAALVASAAYDWYRFERSQNGVVAVAEVEARKGDAVSYEPAFTQPLLETTEFHVVERRGDWILVEVAGQQGWIPADAAVVY